MERFSVTGARDCGVAGSIKINETRGTLQNAVQNHGIFRKHIGHLISITDTYYLAFIDLFLRDLSMEIAMLIGNISVATYIW